MEKALAAEEGGLEGKIEALKGKVHHLEEEKTLLIHHGGIGLVSPRARGGAN